MLSGVTAEGWPACNREILDCYPKVNPSGRFFLTNSLSITSGKSTCCPELRPNTFSLISKEETYVTDETVLSIKLMELMFDELKLLE